MVKKKKEKKRGERNEGRAQQEGRLSIWVHLLGKKLQSLY